MCGIVNPQCVGAKSERINLPFNKSFFISKFLTDLVPEFVGSTQAFSTVKDRDKIDPRICGPRNIISFEYRDSKLCAQIDRSFESHEINPPSFSNFDIFIFEKKREIPSRFAQNEARSFDRNIVFQR